MFQKEKFIKNDLFDTDTFFGDLVGVTKNVRMKASIICFSVNAQNTLYVATKPFHKSQKAVEGQENSSKVLEINMVISQKL